MKPNQALSQAVLAVLVVATIAQTQTLSLEDVQDLEKATSVGCIAKDPVTEKADFYFVCRSSKSGEQAWNAALYRSKVAYGNDKFSVYFNIPPSLPIEDGIHGAQVEVGCGKEPQQVAHLTQRSTHMC